MLTEPPNNNCLVEYETGCAGAYCCDCGMNRNLTLQDCQTTCAQNVHCNYFSFRENECKLYRDYDESCIQIYDEEGVLQECSKLNNISVNNNLEQFYVGNQNGEPIGEIPKNQAWVSLGNLSSQISNSQQSQSNCEYGGRNLSVTSDEKISQKLNFTEEDCLISCLEDDYCYGWQLDEDNTCNLYSKYNLHISYEEGSGCGGKLII